MAMISSKVPVCQALKVKIKSAIEKSSRRVAERFCDAVLDLPKLQNLKMLKAKAKWRWNLPKGGSLSGSVILTYCAEWSFATHFWVVVANATLPSCFWLDRERGFKTKITDLLVYGNWVVMGSARESES
uniref:Uncharacterized protein n=1 Tax=Solanum tuberosum TaxID=4113 RepID=M1DYE3_SOLTU